MAWLVPPGKTREGFGGGSAWGQRHGHRGMDLGGAALADSEFLVMAHLSPLLMTVRWAKRLVHPHCLICPALRPRLSVPGSKEVRPWATAIGHTGERQGAGSRSEWRVRGIIHLSLSLLFAVGGKQVFNLFCEQDLSCLPFYLGG